MNGIEDDYGRQINVVYVSQDEEAGRATAREYGVVGTPTFLLLDRRGEPVQVLRGSFPAPVLEEAVEELIEHDAALGE